MAKLTTAARNKLPASKFAGPGRSYPIPDKAHAVAAKARATQFAPPALRAKVDVAANKVLGKKAAAAMPMKQPMRPMMPNPLATPPAQNFYGKKR